MSLKAILKNQSIGKEYNEQKKERMTFKSKFWQRFILFKSFQD